MTASSINNNDSLKNLYYRRQFILARVILDGLAGWNHRLVGDTHLYAHPDLNVCVKKDDRKIVVLIGYLFDPWNPSKTNEEIISDIFSKAHNFDGLINTLKRYGGSFAVIYKTVERFIILHDALGIREIYYCTEWNGIICGSQPNLLAKYSAPRLDITNNIAIRQFYEVDMKLVRSGRLWVGDETYYHNIKHLLPNHYLDITSLKVARYWPNRSLYPIDMKKGSRLVSEYLKGIMSAVTSRAKPMMAVTSGYDSRSLLAASRGVTDKIYYFINKHPRLSEKSGDIKVPKEMFRKIGVPFHIHDVSGPVDEAFKEIFLNNTFMSTELLLPAIYNVYYKEHQDKLNLLGVGEIGRPYYGKAPHDVDGYYLARCMKFRSSAYATAQCEMWLRDARGVADKYNVDLMKLLLWELLLGNWGAVGNSESDIAIEEFDPYDSHYVYEIMLSVDATGPELFETMIEEMWPELLAFPFNPPDTLMDWIKLRMERLGLYTSLKRWLYKFDRWRFMRTRSTDY